MIKVKNEVTAYEINGEQIPYGETKFNVFVENHWNYNERIVLNFEGKKVTVLARDLKAAIENATNVNRY